MAAQPDATLEELRDRVKGLLRRGALHGRFGEDALGPAADDQDDQQQKDDADPQTVELLVSVGGPGIGVEGRRPGAANRAMIPALIRADTAFQPS